MEEMEKLSAKALVLIGIAIIVLFLLVNLTQSNPDNLLLVPILLLTVAVSWYLHRELQKEHQAEIKRGLQNIKDEQEAQEWLRTAFVPKTRILAKQHMKAIVLACAGILLCFIFLWSFFVSGLATAAINTLIGLALFIVFIYYSLTAPKEFTHLFKHVPHRYRHHSQNEWVHGYLLVLPFALFCYLLYSFTSVGGGVISILLGIPGFFFFYTLLFLCLYVITFLYREYQREEAVEARKTAKKILED